jgi:co-chaperonin GroES (HSP10)
MKVTGTIKPLHDKVLVADMNFGEEVTASGIYIPSDNAKGQGVHPRWGRVWAIGPQQQDVKVGEWILVEHGRWTRTIEVELEDGSILEARMVENKAIIMASEEKPTDVIMGKAAGAGGNFNFNIPGAT